MNGGHGAGRGQYKDFATHCLYVIFKRTIFSEVVGVKHRLQGCESEWKPWKGDGEHRLFLEGWGEKKKVGKRLGRKAESVRMF